MSKTLWADLSEAAWVARCALEMLQLEPNLDPRSAKDLARSLLVDAKDSFDSGELASTSPEESAHRFYVKGWLDYWTSRS